MGTINLNTPIMFSDPLPEAADVVVVGAGVIGVSTAYFLAEQGLRVVVCEKGRVAGEQSSRNWGWVRIGQRDPREVPLMAESLRIWRGLEQRIGRDMGYRKAGIVFTCATDLEYRQNEGWRENLDQYQIDTRMLSPGEVSQMFPAANFDVKGALFSADDGRAEPQKAAPAIAEAARDRGAHVLTECAVRGIETSAGAVIGVVTERGAITCDAVVLAGGAW